MPCSRHSARIAVRRPAILLGKRSISVTVLVTMLVLSGFAAGGDFARSADRLDERDRAAATLNRTNGPKKFAPSEQSPRRRPGNSWFVPHFWKIWEGCPTTMARSMPGSWTRSTTTTSPLRR